MNLFQQYAEFYDYFYLKKDYEYEVNFIINLFNKKNFNKGSIVEFGSGTGKHAKVFNNNSEFYITGYEISEDMIKKSYKSKKFKPKLGDIRLSGQSNKYNAALSIFHVINYLVKKKDLESAFSNISRVLKKKGLVFLDYWENDINLRRKFLKGESVNKVNFGNDTEIERKLEIARTSTKNTLNLKMNFSIFQKDKLINNFSENHKLRYFSEKELVNLAKKYGFNKISSGFFPSKNIQKNNFSYKYLFLQKA